MGDHDHIPTFYLRALSPPPHFPIRCILFLYLRIYRFKSATKSSSLFTAPHWRHPWFSHPLGLHASLRPPILLLPLQQFPPLHWDLNTRLNFKQNSLRKETTNHRLAEKRALFCVTVSHAGWILIFGLANQNFGFFGLKWILKIIRLLMHQSVGSPAPPYPGKAGE